MIMTPDPSLQGAVERARRLASRLDRPEFGAGWARYPSEATIADAEAIRTILAALPEPPTEDADAAGCAEREVGRAIYERIEALMSSAKDATPEGRELSYLADLVASVEEYGSWNGPTEPIAVPDDVIEVAARTHYNHHYGPEGWDSLTDRARRRLTFRMRAALPEPPSKSAESGEREKALEQALSAAAIKIESITMLDIERWACDGKTLKAGMAKIGSIAKQARAALAAAPKPPEKPRAQEG